MDSFVVFEIWSRGEDVGKRDLKMGVTPMTAVRAESAELACRAVATKTGKLTNYIAVPGIMWGIDLVEVDGVEELGLEPDEESVTEKRIRDLERRDLERQLEIGAGDQG